MNLYVATTFYPHEEHPRDMLWFDVYADHHTCESALPHDKASFYPSTFITLPLEHAYTHRSQQKSLALSSTSLEAKIISVLRELARTAVSSPLIHAYRCLATCLDNYARYGGENAVARVLALAYRLSLQHSSKPYRAAFNQAYSDLSKLVACHKSNHVVSERPPHAPPERVFYTLVQHTSSTPLPPVRIRLFQREEDAVLHLTDMLQEYGIPFEVWRSLRSAMADETLPYVQDSLFFSMGEKKVIT